MMAYQTIYPYTNEVLRSYENLSDAGMEEAWHGPMDNTRPGRNTMMWKSGSKSCARWLPCSGGTLTGMRKL